MADTYLVIPSLPHRTKRDASHLIPTRARLKEDSHINYFNDMDIRLEAFEANQVVNFVTWTRTVNGNVRESISSLVFAIRIYAILPFCIHEIVSALIRHTLPSTLFLRASHSPLRRRRKNHDVGESPCKYLV